MYKCLTAYAFHAGSSVDNQNNDYTATSGVKNLFATFNEADDQRQAVNENDQTGTTQKTTIVLMEFSKIKLFNLMGFFMF